MTATPPPPSTAEVVAAVGAIVGGVVAVVLALVFAVWLYNEVDDRRRRRRDSDRDVARRCARWEVVVGAQDGSYYDVGDRVKVQLVRTARDGAWAEVQQRLAVAEIEREDGVEQWGSLLDAAVAAATDRAGLLNGLLPNRTQAMLDQGRKPR